MRPVRAAALPLAAAAAALAVAVAAVGAGCSSAPVRKVPTALGANARIYIDDKRMERDAKGVIAVPVDGRETLEVRIEEPRKPPIVFAVRVYDTPAADLEDRLVASTTVNTVIVYTGQKGGSMAGATRPVELFPDPLALLRDAEGPFFGPAAGQGLVVVASDGGATLKVDGAAVALRPARAESGAPSLPEAVTLPPGVHAVRVEAPGSKPFEAQVEVKPEEFALLAVRLAPESRAEGAK